MGEDERAWITINCRIKSLLCKFIDDDRLCDGYFVIISLFLLSFCCCCRCFFSHWKWSFDVAHFPVHFVPLPLFQVSNDNEPTEQITTGKLWFHSMRMRIEFLVAHEEPRTMQLKSEWGKNNSWLHMMTVNWCNLISERQQKAKLELNDTMNGSVIENW